MKLTRIFALTLISTAVAAVGFGASMTSGVSGVSATGSNASGASSNAGSSTIHENSGVFTTPNTTTAPGENTAPRVDPAVQPDNFNTTPRDLPPVDAGGTGATSGDTGTPASGALTPPAVPANDASVNGPGANIANNNGNLMQDVPDRESSHVPNGTAGSRPLEQDSTVR